MIYKIKIKKDLITLQAAINHIINNYINSKAQSTKDHPMGTFLRNSVVNTFKDLIPLPWSKYSIKGSIGVTKWAEVPWISLFDLSITDKATTGYYIVYLFKADMTGVYLSLNQGCTYFTDKFGSNKETKKKIKHTADYWKHQLNITDDFTLPEINLKSNSRKNVALPKMFEAGHIAGKYYEANNIPATSTLVSDLLQLVVLYNELKFNMGSRTFDQMASTILSIPANHFIITTEIEEDAQFQNDVQINKNIKTETKEEPQNPSDPIFDKGGRRRWPRDPNIASEALFKAEYTCQIDHSHKTFISIKTEMNFVEAHHLIPISKQNEFTHNLDVPGNIVALCPNCHRKIHHSSHEDKILMLDKLYKLKIKSLLNFGIALDLEQLINYYK